MVEFGTRRFYEKKYDKNVEYNFSVRRSVSEKIEFENVTNYVLNRNK